MGGVGVVRAEPSRMDSCLSEWDNAHNKSVPPVQVLYCLHENGLLESKPVSHGLALSHVPTCCLDFCHELQQPEALTRSRADTRAILLNFLASSTMNQNKTSVLHKPPCLRYSISATENILRHQVKCQSDHVSASSLCLLARCDQSDP